MKMNHVDVMASVGHLNRSWVFAQEKIKMVIRMKMAVAVSTV